MWGEGELKYAFFRNLFILTSNKFDKQVSWVAEGEIYA